MTAFDLAFVIGSIVILGIAAWLSYQPSKFKVMAAHVIRYVVPAIIPAWALAYSVVNYGKVHISIAIVGAISIVMCAMVLTGAAVVGITWLLFQLERVWMWAAKQCPLNKC